MLKRIVADMRSHRSLAGLTVGRLVLIPAVILFISEGARLATFLTLTAFLLVDYFDGVIARRRGADGPTRRALDSASDRIAIWAVLITMVALSYAALPIILLLAMRDVYCVYLCAQPMRERFVAIGADWPYRGLNACLALWVIIAPEISHPARTAALGGIALFSLFVAYDLRIVTMRVRALPGSVVARVISAGELRTWQQRLIRAVRSRSRARNSTLAATH
jgi:phosphatidylglycerophosphate synthase